MTRNLTLTFLLMVYFSAVAPAGTIQDKISGASGTSVVYVDAIPGKDFPAPSQSKVIDQKKLSFDPHITVIQVGTTVDFQNDESTQHNVFWPSISGNKKLVSNLGT